jgi:hypothetical protein
MLADWEKLAGSSLIKEFLDDLKTVVAKQEIHRAQNFIGHIDQDAPIGNPYGPHPLSSLAVLESLSKFSHNFRLC